MFIYNVTTKVHWQIHEQWVSWMKQNHVPSVIATGCFTKYQMVRILETDETEGPTYAVQYFCHTKEDYERYLQTYATLLRTEVFNRWGNLIISFNTLMELVH